MDDNRLPQRSTPQGGAGRSPPAGAPAGALMDREQVIAGLLRHAQDLLAARFAARAGDTTLDELLARWQTGEIAPGSAAAAVLELLARTETDSAAS